MEYIVNETAFSTKQNFRIYDMHGDVVYNVTGRFARDGGEMHLLDRKGNEQAQIQKTHDRLVEVFDIHLSDGKKAQARKRFEWGAQLYDVESWDGKTMTLTADMSGDDCALHIDKACVMDVEEQHSAWGRRYIIHIPGEEYALLGLCLLMVIDHKPNA